ncbi:hypothetical protein RUM43_002219 [Polyplax serrata]|uniref:Chitin-binding type-2 domain-containing protein n=1 Tax=Polyplax serrata TaxID=468196 RepID=A0AAN8PM26_POLSC
MELFKSGLLFLRLLLGITFAHSTSGRETRSTVPCVEDGTFFRNPKQSPAKMWVASECAKYYLCLDGEVFEFKCSFGLLFDVKRQICDFKANVDNCDVPVDRKAPKPLLGAAECPNQDELGCADGTCLVSEFFCDGSVDCPDGSDEGWCDMDHDPHGAPPCDPRQCHLPDCFCSKDGTRIPGNLSPLQVPQMIILTFDDAINVENWNLYTEHLFTPDKKNANGCPIRGTFYVSHQYTNYQQTQKMWNDGHEIAVHSITHRGPEDWWSKNATIEDWFDEMVGQANILNRFASVRLEELRGKLSSEESETGVCGRIGIRVPFLRVGWNRQFLMMKEFGFQYDSSIVAPFSDPPLWPYTLDYKMPHKCQEVNQHCPTRSYPGLWEMVMNQLTADSYTCAMVDDCPTDLTGEDIYNMLHHNLQRHYTTNRAPFGIFFHSTWFKRAEYMKAFESFVSDVVRRPDIWFVTNWQAIQWMQNPTPLNEINDFEPWSCKKDIEQHEIACTVPNSCKLYSRILHGERYLYTCAECPQQYPWIRNEFGQD